MKETEIMTKDPCHIMRKELLLLGVVINLKRSQHWKKNGLKLDYKLVCITIPLKEYCRTQRTTRESNQDDQRFETHFL